MKTILSTLAVISAMGVIFFSALFLQSCKHNENTPPDYCDTCLIVMKPNIYLYPQQTVNLTVQLGFPLGGRLLESTPAYGNGWNVTVTSGGMIDNEYRYLFYESKQPNVWQRYEGWVVSKADLEPFFTDNMAAYGFNNQEISDFTNYWIPRLTDFNYYVIYPQATSVVNTVITLKISKQPDSILRLFYLITGCNAMPSTAPLTPVITPFVRNGFVVAEWGVLQRPS